MTWITRLLGAAGFGALGWRLGSYVSQVSSDREQFLPWGLALSLAGMPIGAFAAPYISTVPLTKGMDRLSQVPTPTLMSGIVGLFIGLALASLISIPLYNLEGWMSWGVPLMLSFSFGGLGLLLGIQRETDINDILPHNGTNHRNHRVSSSTNGRILVDTSAIIDGRIADLTHTGFLHGTLVVPRFVLDELRHIADRPSLICMSEKQERPQSVVSLKSQLLHCSSRKSVIS